MPPSSPQIQDTVGAGEGGDILLQASSLQLLKGQQGDWSNCPIPFSSEKNTMKRKEGKGTVNARVGRRGGSVYLNMQKKTETVLWSVLDLWHFGFYFSILCKNISSADKKKLRNTI